MTSTDAYIAMALSGVGLIVLAGILAFVGRIAP